MRIYLSSLLAISFVVPVVNAGTLEGQHFQLHEDTIIATPHAELTNSSGTFRVELSGPEGFGNAVSTGSLGTRLESEVVVLRQSFFQFASVPALSSSAWALLLAGFLALGGVWARNRRAHVRSEDSPCRR